MAKSKLAIAGWLGALALMLAFLGTPPVQRTQEARVLETAREMLGNGWRDWMIPHLNGQIRLEKPPLAYWLAAAAFKIGGVSEGIGRVPFAVLGWLTLIVTWLIASRLFGQRAAFFAAASLLGGWLFARHARLAETDILATCFVTAAVYCILRDAWRLSGVMIGLAVMGKGLPAGFVVVFLIALAAARRDWQLLWRWTRSGAPLLAVLIAAPWFVYAGTTVGWSRFAEEASVGLAGGEHTAWAIQYLPQTLVGVAPWTAMAVLAVAASVSACRRETRIRDVLVWAGAIFVPLCVARQRQFHYLLPAMPALACLTGWLIDQTFAREKDFWKLSRALLIGTMVFALLASVAAPLAGPKIRGSPAPADWIIAMICGGTAIVALAMLSRCIVAGTVVFAVGAALAMMLVAQLWSPTLRKGNPRTIAAQIRAAGSGPYVFYGQSMSLPLLFYLGEIVPQKKSPQELADAAAANPALVVIAQTKSAIAPPDVPQGFERTAQIVADDQTLDVYRLRQ